jgi:histidinol-phosphate aminotransferase
MNTKRFDYISTIERRQASRINTSSGFRLDMAERLFDFPDGFIEAFLDELNHEDFIVYPKIELYDKLKKYLSKINQIAIKNFLIDSGSDAIIKNCFHSLCNDNDSIIISSPSFPMYKIYASMFALKTQEIGFNETPVFDLDNILSAIDSNTKMVILANPNSPYGDKKSMSEIQNLLNILYSKNIYLMLDEAYVDFGDKTLVSLINKFDNLIVLKTFSKAWGAAGMRVGYCISNLKNIQQIEKVQLTYPVSNVSLKFAIYLCKNSKMISEYAEETILERDLLIKELRNAGYMVLDSSNNSIHFHDSFANEKVINIFNKYKVSFKTGSSASTPLVVPGDKRTDWIRISVGKGIMKTDYIKELLTG